MKTPITDLVEALRKDEDYLYSWVANIAVAFQDEYSYAKDKKDIHKISNDAAKRFMKILMMD